MSRTSCSNLSNTAGLVRVAVDDDPAAPRGVVSASDEDPATGTNCVQVDVGKAAAPPTAPGPELLTAPPRAPAVLTGPTAPTTAAPAPPAVVAGAPAVVVAGAEAVVETVAVPVLLLVAVVARAA